MTTILAAFGNINSYKGSIQNFAIVGITIVVEQFSTFLFFFCPCDYPRNQTYGSTFIWGPAATLLVVGYLANRRTWRLVTGLCHRTQPLFKGGKRVIHFLFIFASIGVKALIAPATWVVLAFLKGEYYACAHWPNPYKNIAQSRSFYQLYDIKSNLSFPKPCMFNPDPAAFKSDVEADVIARTLRAESHTIAWLYLTLAMVISVTIKFFMQCQSNFSYEQSNYIERYREHEIELFEAQLDAKAKIQAERIVNGYFSKTRAKEDWDKIAIINDKITHNKRGKAVYSPLHRFVNKEKMKDEKEFVDGDLVQDTFTKSRHVESETKKTSNDSNRNFNATAPAVQFIPMVVPHAEPSQLSVFLNQRSPMQSGTLSSDPLHTQSRGDKGLVSEKTFQKTNEANASTRRTTTAVQDPFTDPSKIGSMTSNASSSSLHQPILTGGQNFISPPFVLSPLKQEQPCSLMTSANNSLSEQDSSVKRTSFGDFGGYFSREDLRKFSESGNDNKSRDTGDQSDSSDTKIFDQMQEDREGYVPTLEIVDDVPLLTKEM